MLRRRRLQSPSDARRSQSHSVERSLPGALSAGSGHQKYPIETPSQCRWSGVSLPASDSEVMGRPRVAFRRRSTSRCLSFQYRRCALRCGGGGFHSLASRWASATCPEVIVVANLSRSLAAASRTLASEAREAARLSHLSACTSSCGTPCAHHVREGEGSLGLTINF